MAESQEYNEYNKGPISENLSARTDPAGSGRTAAALARPAVSVIVLNLNGERIIGRCLDHLLAQSFREFEIIVVDNNSADSSVAVAQAYLGCGKLSILRSNRNLGVPGGRNLGMEYAQGEIIAFIDNDAYAHKNWLAVAVGRLESDEQAGAVASTVFFAGHKVILNGSGGTINRLGYGGDCCYRMPFEFVRVPSEVLYAMGCGMVVRRKALSRMRRFDPLTIKWFEDVEAGIWLWCSGYKVVVAEDAWIDHDAGTSDAFLPERVYMCERARIRTVLKYYPARQLMPWLANERRHEAALAEGPRAQVRRAWLWNIRHLPSAMRWRIRARHKNRFWPLLDGSLGFFPPPMPPNEENRPDLSRAQPLLVLDGENDVHQLNFGWYHVERDADRSYRWTALHASALFRLRAPAITCTVAFRSQIEQQVRVVVRPLGTLKPCAEGIFEATDQWSWRTLLMHLWPGSYELLLLCGSEFVEPSGRRIGVAVSSIHFE